ncbi:class I SAM-dependent methyltransferase [Pseudooceanicola sp. MF1-13]|uniref:class I SAM-dependent methyltransferase n=1 Tax=Pseudooceanicola sp. MF1-13 TaxID=3379095 RepID=UPI0038919033
MKNTKNDVREFWNEASCGEALYLSELSKEGYDAQAEERYTLEPWIERFADYPSSEGKKTLEIGVGLGAEHQKFCEAGADMYGIDLTQRAIEHVERRLALNGLTSRLSIGDAECLNFDDCSFDIVYSYGVLHHTPNTPQAVNEVHRVLKPGGTARVMIYHKWSFVGLMLWIRYGLFKFRPFIGLNKLYDKYLESPGTKAYSIREAEDIFSSFRKVKIETLLSHADLLNSNAGQRHRGMALSLAKMFWPRILIRNLFPKFGLVMLIIAEK